MKTIIDVFKEGSAKDRLAVIADITSLVGVSVASVVGGMLAVTSRFTSLDGGVIAGYALFSLFSIIVLMLIVILFIYANASLSQPWKSAPTGVQPLVKVVFWLFFAFIMIGSISFFYTLITTVQIH